MFLTTASFQTVKEKGGFPRPCLLEHFRHCSLQRLQSFPAALNRAVFPAVLAPVKVLIENVPSFVLKLPYGADSLAAVECPAVEVRVGMPNGCYGRKRFFLNGNVCHCLAFL